MGARSWVRNLDPLVGSWWQRNLDISWGQNFDLERFLEYLPHHGENSAEFRSWADSAERTFSQLFERLI
jgi:hypothetical protein